ncbi:hypothetical protein OC835_004142 [Tilletia horrida]|nr:hypothetical protein OC835_004142 [Tilletia horrida]
MAIPIGYVPDWEHEHYVEREIDYHLKRKDGGTRGGIVFLCIDFVRRCTIAERKRDEVQERMDKLQIEHQELQEETERLRHTAYAWVGEDGQGGPSFHKARRCVDRIKSKLRILRSAYQRLDEVNSELLTENVRLKAAANPDPLLSGRRRPTEEQLQQRLDENHQTIQQLKHSLEDTTERLRRAEDEILALRSQLEQPPPLPYLPRDGVEPDNIESLRKEVERLAHNDAIRQRATDFYEWRYKHTVRKVDHLREEVEIFHLMQRCHNEERNKELRRLRARLLDAMASSSAGLSAPYRVDDCQRWTQHERDGFFDMPRPAANMVVERRSSPAVLVLRAGFDVEQVHADVTMEVDLLEDDIRRQLEDVLP